VSGGTGGSVGAGIGGFVGEGTGGSVGTGTGGSVGAGVDLMVARELASTKKSCVIADPNFPPRKTVSPST